MIEARFDWHGGDAFADISSVLADRLLRMAVYFQTQHKLRLNVSNPRPYLNSSKPGEYPRARTGFGRDSVMYEPTSRSEVRRDLTIRIGYLVNAFYMPVLELTRNRLGLRKTLDDLHPQLQLIAARA